jgi:hypothetical protein
MIQVIFTLDYEIHGNGEGCPQRLMVGPTDRLIQLLDEYGAKLTIMADIPEILKFKEYKERYGRDDYSYEDIAAQLQRSISERHDVQLHLHSAYFNARYDGRRWTQDWSEYNFAGLPLERMNWMVKTCKDFLESLLRPVDPLYRCTVFRAANWSVSPSKNVVHALIENGIEIDTSVFKYGRRDGLVTFDYSHAISQTGPWRVSEKDICTDDAEGHLWESPIYSEYRWVGAFLTSSRIYRALITRRHSVKQESLKGISRLDITANHSRRLGGFRRLFERHAWKADFNQCSGDQLIRALKRVQQSNPNSRGEIPFVLIGHSKLFNSRNAKQLESFLKYVADEKNSYNFGKFNSLHLIS